MKKQDIPALAVEVLKELLDRPGSILYSSHETLKPGDVYLLGFNPGGTEGRPIVDSINSLLSKELNAYLDESWENLNGSWNEGGAPLQKRVRWVLEEMGLNPREVCSSNLIFFQSRSAEDVNYALAKRCWPVHEALIGIVQPKVVVTFGNSSVSPYSYLRAMFGGEEEVINAGHGSLKVKGFHTLMNGRSVFVAGLPHLSRYSPIGKHFVINWLLQNYTPSQNWKSTINTG